MKFSSKKNRVSLENGVVVKRFGDKAALAREAQTLGKLWLAGLGVPALLGGDENSLWLEYIPGRTYADLVESMTAKKAEALAFWLREYHRLSGGPRGDANLRNFLWTGRECVGVDFEDPPSGGEREADPGRIIAFAATYRPPFSPRKAEGAALILGAFLKTGSCREKIREAYLAEISAMNHRRQDCPVAKEAALSFFDGLMI